MENMLQVMEGLLSESDRKIYERIYEPTVVAVAPKNVLRDMMIMPDGEIRYYAFDDCEDIAHIWDEWTHGGVEEFYLSSRDCGLSWKKIYTQKGVMGSCVKVPGKERYITLKSGSYTGSSAEAEETGTYVYISEIGPDDTNPRKIKIADEPYIQIYQPQLLSTGRWITTMEYHHNEPIDRPVPIYQVYHSVVAWSDDEGETWQLTELKPTDRFEKKWPHKGYRWDNNGGECTLTELSDGRLKLICRNALDYFWEYYSSDGGETWTDGEPSRFHGTLTTPGYLKLQDGRLIQFWNNTRPLAEADHEKVWPPLPPSVLSGLCPDGFTNRDANHVAITEDDGETWIGYRELGLNAIRNNADFRSCGRMLQSGDKSVHQFQAFELPLGKVLVAYGQNETSARLVIFDVNWLYETERKENFVEGFKNLSTHMYVKSIGATWLHENKPGHCHWNRTNGALLVPDPDDNHGEALQINRISDSRLRSELQGMVWNFPAMKQGVVEFDMRVAGAGLRVSLADHWMNACDEYVGYFAQFSTELDERSLGCDKWIRVKIEIDTEQEIATYYADDMRMFSVRMQGVAVDGLSYLHLQTLAGQADEKGSYVRNLHAKRQ